MELLNAAYEGRLDDLKYLLEVGRYDVNVADDKGRTALHLAACKNNVLMAEYLMSKGADSGKIDINNNTPLHLAALGGFSKVSAVILANSKAEAVMAEDMHGNTPLYLAHVKLKKMKQNFNNKPISDVQEELHYIIDIISEFVEKHGSPDNREKLYYLKQRIAQIQGADGMDEVDSLLQSLSLF